MTELGQVVQSLAAREGVEGALLLSGDGLPIQHAARRELDAETVAALAATVAQHAARLGEGAGRGDLTTAVLEFAGGLVVLARAGACDWLAILAGADADIGPLLFDLRQHRPALGSLL
ncbi:MAG TPA: roadblock/LC7 domain-containing protein [Gemmatimonadales bacterium]